jgi:hypothetical protein
LALRQEPRKLDEGKIGGAKRDDDENVFESFYWRVRWAPVAEGKERMSYQKKMSLKLDVMQTSMSKQ